jgi:hypothetical protein
MEHTYVKLQFHPLSTSSIRIYFRLTSPLHIKNINNLCKMSVILFDIREMQYSETNDSNAVPTILSHC